MIRLRKVNTRHYVCRTLGRYDRTWDGFIINPQFTNRMPEPAKDFLDYSCARAKTRYAIIATENGKLIGFLRYDFGRSNRCLDASGTWVAKSHRKQGLATRLWQYALRSHKPALVNVTVLNTKSAKLLAKIKNQNPKVSFDIHQECEIR